MKISKTFCVAPWIHLAISTSGIFRPCCNVSYLKEDYKEEINHSKYRIHKDKIEDVWNSEFYTSMRKSMLEGKKIEVCAKCYREEEIGIISSRMSLNNDYLHYIDHIEQDGTCSVDSIKYIDVRLGNKCNLKCRMCNPYASNQWIPEERKFHLRQTNLNHFHLLEKMDWFEKDLFWNNLISIMKNCEVLYFAGGEPTLFNEKKYKLFDECIKNGWAKNILLRYNTNITYLPDTLIEYWRYFKKVVINCSIDAFDKINEYIRFPSKWENIDKNLRILYDLKKQSVIHLSVHTTVQILNVFYLVDLFEYLKQFKMFPFLNILNHPAIYNIRVLHKDQKDQVRDKINDWYNKNIDFLKKYDIANNSKKLLQIIEYMYKEDWSHLYPDFKNETSILDESRNQKSEEYIPELVEV